MAKREIPEIDGVAYAWESVLGQGGTAEVWKVRSCADGREYALKRIDKRDASERRIERFRNEIAFGLSTRSAHVVRIHAQLEDEDYFYYTMDLFPKSLRDVIAEVSDYAVLLEYLSQLCEGIAEVHADGIVHRDIKPENILVDVENQNLVVADFGIAHFKDSTLTRRGELLANRNYQAPEQMTKGGARGVGKAADVFALGVIATEMFTKENPRGGRHRKVADVHPFLSDIDLLVEQMMLQDDTQRIRIEAVRDRLRVIRRQVDTRAEDIRDGLRRTAATERAASAERVLDQAAKDVLSAKYIFERTDDDDLGRYNPMYHSEIRYSASAELYNACVQSSLYTFCKSKFENEAVGDWNQTDLGRVLAPEKAQLVDEFERIQARYPLPRWSVWASLPTLAAHYFRFCKDYHCEELIAKAKHLTADYGPEALRPRLQGVPILGLVSSVRRRLASDHFPMTPSNRERVEFERHIGVAWNETYLDDPVRFESDLDLLDPTPDPTRPDHILEALEQSWDVSVAERADGHYWIHFRSGAEFERFRAVARALATPDSPFEADVDELLTTEEEFEDLVALVWEPIFQIPTTLAKVLGLREVA
ncbi:serine/threonine protein kinase [Leifsonia shinshuensis]|uniref:serine/threonine-protein kinase n=1 Tax=Leifsonia shinshuensis TaxID=150026 RepID=UPI001F511FA5|nr:serine/threonine-protein kinase [Leifsonia shinshuensis]MCI0155812.1 serine/threonine protein kinase [Leifsonia shinshuensis]